MNDWKDRELGMGRGITRRDFLNGVALTAGAAMLPSDLLAAADMQAGREKSPDYYPPALTGLRGSHPGSFEAAHSLRDGTFWDQAGTPVDTGETYDLVVVGGGISGLSAAHFFRKAAGSKARVLDSRQSRRLRRTRQAQRVSLRPADHAGLWRNVFHRKSGSLQQRGQGPDRGTGNRCRLLSQVREPEFVPLLWPGPEDFFRQGNIRRRQAGHQSDDAHRGESEDDKVRPTRWKYSCRKPRSRNPQRQTTDVWSRKRTTICPA